MAAISLATNQVVISAPAAWGCPVFGSLPPSGTGGLAEIGHRTRTRTETVRTRRSASSKFPALPFGSIGRFRPYADSRSRRLSAAFTALSFTLPDYSECLTNHV